MLQRFLESVFFCKLRPWTFSAASDGLAQHSYFTSIGWTNKKRHCTSVNIFAKY